MIVGAAIIEGGSSYLELYRPMKWYNGPSIKEPVVAQPFAPPSPDPFPSRINNPLSPLRKLSPEVGLFKKQNVYS